MGLVEAIGFCYDSSLMADDYRPYRIRSGDRHSMAMLEHFIDAASSLDGVVFERLDAIVARAAASI